MGRLSTVWTIFSRFSASLKVGINTITLVIACSLRPVPDRRRTLHGQYSRGKAVRQGVSLSSAGESGLPL